MRRSKWRTRLGLTVVAEGAEDDVTCALLAEAGCDLIQGYYLSRPMPPDTIEEWLLGGAMLEFTPLRKDDERTEDSMRDAEQFRSMV